MTLSRNQINLRLPPDLLESIDAFLERKYGPVGVSRTRVLEEWIRQGLAQEQAALERGKPRGLERPLATRGSQLSQDLLSEERDHF